MVKIVFLALWTLPPPTSGHGTTGRIPLPFDLKLHIPA